jgi:transposase
MKLYAGIDLHSNNSVVCLIDETGKEMRCKRLKNDLTELLGFLHPYNEALQGIVVESTYNWYWLVDGLMDHGYCVHLANPARMQQYDGLKYSDDDSDANWLAQLLRLNILPKGYIYPKENRGVRDLMRKRLQLVQDKTMHLLSIQGLYTRQLNRRLSSNAIKQLTEEQIRADFGAAELILAVSSNLEVMNCLEKQILLIEKTLQQQLRLKNEFKQLTSIDGIGLILALTIRLEAGDRSRFAQVGDFSSYCRCIGGARFSNGKKKGATNSKNGNKYLAWAFIEAANFAIRYNEQIKKYYQRKSAKTNNVLAIKTIAHKLCRGCFYVLRDNVTFDVMRTFGT